MAHKSAPLLLVSKVIDKRLMTLTAYNYVPFQPPIGINLKTRFHFFAPVEEIFFVWDGQRVKCGSDKPGKGSSHSQGLNA
jgi:hypothetical protein